MIIYNVTVTVHEEIAPEWVKWIKNTHAQEVLDTKCFHNYELFEILEHQEEGVKTYAVKYYADTMEDYQNYVNEHAETLRRKGFELFGDKFIAFRTLMKAL